MKMQAEEDQPLDYTGGSLDDLHMASEMLSNSGWPYLLMVPRKGLNYDMFCDLSPDSAMQLIEIFSDEVLMRELRDTLILIANEK